MQYYNDDRYFVAKDPNWERCVLVVAAVRVCDSCARMRLARCQAQDDQNPKGQLVGLLDDQKFPELVEAILQTAPIKELRVCEVTGCCLCLHQLIYNARPVHKFHVLRGFSVSSS